MVHFAQSRPAALFHSCARCTPRGVRVTPFGHPGIKGCVPLPPAFRSLPRPSSHRLPWASAPDLSLAWPYCSFPRAASYGFLRAPFLLFLCVSFPVPVKYLLSMGQNRVELLTPALSERCSNQLSYCPIFLLCLTTKGKKEEKEECRKETVRAVHLHILAFLSERR